MPKAQKRTKTPLCYKQIGVAVVVARSCQGSERNMP